MRTKVIIVALVSLLPFALTSAVPEVQLPFQIKSSSSITDLLTRSGKSRLFYDYVRESSTVSTRLGNPLEATTVFAPVNSAIVALARKPHQGPPEPVGGHVQGYAGSRQDEDAMADYLERWIKRHLVAGKIDLEEDAKVYETLLEGHKLSVVRTLEEGKTSFKVMPGDIEVIEIEQASNGVILYLQGTLNIDNID